MQGTFSFDREEPKRSRFFSMSAAELSGDRAADSTPVPGVQIMG